MEFARQEYFWLLPVVPLAVLLWGIGLWHQRRMRIRFGNIENLQSISRISWPGRGWLRGLLFVAALALMALGLAYPRAIVRELRAVPTRTDLVFLLDTSPSMYGRDMDPSRLGRAERIIQRFIYLKQPQDRYGLIAFNWTSVVLFSSLYITHAKPSWRRLERQAVRCALFFARARIGNRREARMAIVATTASNSNRVKPRH